MFVVIYQFELKPQSEKEFIENWQKLTQAFIEQSGGLGSRLHKSSNGQWIAYAEWPDRETWAKDKSLTKEALAARENMRACCQSVQVLFELEPISDLLVHHS